MRIKLILICAVMLLLLVPVTSYGQKYSIAATDTTTLNAPGVSTAVWCAGFSKLIWYYKVANINTNVVIALQIKKRNSEWTSVWSSGITHTANGNYGIEFSNVSLADSVRFRFVSEAGGTDAAITHCVALAGGI